MYCRRCGYENEDDAQICVSCGKTVTIVTAQIKQETAADIHKAAEESNEGAVCFAESAAAPEQKKRGRQGVKWVAASLVIIGVAGAALEIIVSAAGF